MPKKTRRRIRRKTKDKKLRTDRFDKQSTFPISKVPIRKKGKGGRAKQKSADFKRRSKASKKGWRRRKAREKIEAQAKAKPKTKRGKLKEWLVTWAYQGAASKKNKGSKSRSAGFIVIARSAEDASLFVTKAVASGEDSSGADLTWMEQVPWDEVDVTSPEQGEEKAPDQKTIRALGAGYVELR